VVATIKLTVLHVIRRTSHRKVTEYLDGWRVDTNRNKFPKPVTKPMTDVLTRQQAAAMYAGLKYQECSK